MAVLRAGLGEGQGESVLLGFKDGTDDHVASFATAYGVAGVCVLALVVWLVKAAKASPSTMLTVSFALALVGTAVSYASLGAIYQLYPHENPPTPSEWVLLTRVRWVSLGLAAFGAFLVGLATRHRPTRDLTVVDWMVVSVAVPAVLVYWYVAVGLAKDEKPESDLRLLGWSFHCAMGLYLLLAVLWSAMVRRRESGDEDKQSLLARPTRASSGRHGLWLGLSVVLLVAAYALNLATDDKCGAVNAAEFHGCVFPDEFNHNAVTHVVVAVSNVLLVVGGVGFLRATSPDLQRSDVVVG